jgi:hypothetical protein
MSIEILLNAFAEFCDMKTHETAFGSLAARAGLDRKMQGLKAALPGRSPCHIAGNIISWAMALGSQGEGRDP